MDNVPQQNNSMEGEAESLIQYPIYDHTADSKIHFRYSDGCYGYELEK